MRSKILLLLVGAVAALAVACRDAVVAPTRNLSALSASASSSSAANRSASNRTVVGTLELSPNGGIYHVGEFDVVIPAGAVCNPATSKYGDKHWDDDCAPLMTSLTVQVVAETRASGVSVDFQPDIRFRPSAGWVTIQTRAYSSLLASSEVRQISRRASYFQNFAILYAPTGGSSRIDEVRSTGDASMVTHVDLSTGLVWRRVKHFSGYLINAGFNCPAPLPDGTCSSPDPTSIVGDPLAQTNSAVIVDTLTLSPSVVIDP